MFDQTFVDTHAQTRRPWTVALSLALQTMLVVVILLAPLLNVAVLQKPDTVPLWLPRQTVSKAAETQVKPAAQSAPGARRVFHLASQQTPIATPRSIDLAPDAPLIGNAGSGSIAGSAIFGILADNTVSPPPPAASPIKPRQTPPSSLSTPIQVTGGVQSAKLIFGPKPAYPPLAKETRTQGTVRIQAIIGRDGTIRDLRILSGPPLLIEAAKEAVSQWRYQPTLLNSQAVEVITEIDVNFTMAQ